MNTNEELLREALRPFLHEESSRIDSFQDDDMEGYVKGVIAYRIEGAVIHYVKANPNATVQDLYHLLAECDDVYAEDEEG